jgi:hypothetical protein
MGVTPFGDNSLQADWKSAALLPRIGFRANQADRVLIESFEAAFALQILQMTHDRPSPQNAFVGWGSGVKLGTDR